MYHLHRNDTEYQDDTEYQKRVVHSEQCKGPNTLPYGAQYSNKLGYDLLFEVITT